MDQQAFKEVVRMLESFPQTSGNPDLTVSAYELAIAGLSSQAVIETAQRFVSGLVEGQSMDFAPATPRFAQEARKRQEIIDTIAQPRLAARGYVSAGHLRPFEILRQKALTKFQDCPVIKENVSHAEFQAMSKAQQVPVGGGWCAATCTVYGPPFEQISLGKRKQA